MVRTQVQLTEEQLATLRSLAAQQEVSVSELVRRAVDILAVAQPTPSPVELRRRAIAVAGRFAFGDHDVARRHDDYLAEAFAS